MKSAPFPTFVVLQSSLPLLLINWHPLIQWNLVIFRWNFFERKIFNSVAEVFPKTGGDAQTLRFRIAGSLYNRYGPWHRNEVAHRWRVKSPFFLHVLRYSFTLFTSKRPLFRWVLGFPDKFGLLSKIVYLPTEPKQIILFKSLEEHFRLSNKKFMKSLKKIMNVNFFRRTFHRYSRSAGP